MVEYLLGNYLVETGKITKEQLTEVVKSLDSARAKLGLIAVSEGMLTTQQADEINLLQSVQDKRFGDIAIEKGYLTADQVGKLLKKQGGVYLSFVQKLLDEKLLQMDELDLMINDFKKVNDYSNSDFEDIKSDEVERILPFMLPKEAEPYSELIGTVVRTLIRLVDRHLYLGKAAIVDEFPQESLALQKMEGEGGMVDCFSERDGALLKLCSIFGREDFEGLDIFALDAAAELLNCCNGMYVSELSRQGHFLELTPPDYAGVGGAKEVCRIPIFIANSGLYFVVGKL